MVQLVLGSKQKGISREKESHSRRSYLLASAVARQFVVSYENGDYQVAQSLTNGSVYHHLASTPSLLLS